MTGVTGGWTASVPLACSWRTLHGTLCDGEWLLICPWSDPATRPSCTAAAATLPTLQTAPCAKSVPTHTAQCAVGGRTGLVLNTRLLRTLLLSTPLLVRQCLGGPVTPSPYRPGNLLCAAPPLCRMVTALPCLAVFPAEAGPTSCTICDDPDMKYGPDLQQGDCKLCAVEQCANCQVISGLTAAAAGSTL